MTATPTVITRAVIRKGRRGESTVATLTTRSGIEYVVDLGERCRSLSGRQLVDRALDAQGAIAGWDLTYRVER